MEVMEEGNLEDRVPILIQRDMQYYQNHQRVLQETICTGIVGGKLDFPRYASFAAVKIVIWWEDEYYAAYRKNSGLLHLDEVNNDEIDDGEKKIGNNKVIVKASDPEKFVSSVTKSADKLLDHIHTLSQEALDHADLTVLTATIGAAALIKNTLWVYQKSVTTSICRPKGDEPGGSLKISYKQYSEMTEALAERLLDLHCRLLLLYIIQDADCLNWDSQQPFFESERGSYTIQMWWLYMQGTKQDLWNSVPPNMAQRVLAGMLNDTLTILTVRYAQISPSQQRTQLMLVDLCNLLHCVCEIFPSICENGEAFVGLNITNQSKIVRDVHAKCQELLCCLLLRGAPLGVLYKVIQKGTTAVKMFGSRQGFPSPWIIFTLPKFFPPSHNSRWANHCSDFSINTAIALEIKILLNSPQANWPLLLKILLMRNSKLSAIILHHLMKNLPTRDCFIDSLDQPFMSQKKSSKCEGFLCGKECNKIGEWINTQIDPVGQTNYQIVLALSYVLILTGKLSDITTALMSALEKSLIKDWASCLDRRQVWNLKRPPWYEAILHFVFPILDPIIHMLVSAVQTGATIYQAMSLSISCLSEMWECIPNCLYTVAMALTETISTDIRPLGGSVLIQILFSALYTKLIECTRVDVIGAAAGVTVAGETSAVTQPPVAAPIPTPPPLLISSTSTTNINSDPLSWATSTKETICNILAEAICSIDEDDKHTDAISALIIHAHKNQDFDTMLNQEFEDTLTGLSSARVDDPEESRSSSSATYTKIIPEFDVEQAGYIPELLVSDVLVTSVGKQSLKLLYTYLRNNAEWLLQQLNLSDIELSEFKSLPGQNIHEEKSSLLKVMFHIGHQPFDQLLTGGIRIDYNHWLQTPMSITPERAWLQVSQRHEFQENVKLSVQDTVMVAAITAQLKDA